MDSKDGREKKSRENGVGTWNGSGRSRDDEGRTDDSEEDECVYTYKGDQLADLPSSFFRFDASEPAPPELTNGRSAEEPPPHLRIPRNPQPQPNGQNMYSPEMDFLEMDFDPGGTGDDTEPGSPIGDDIEMPNLSLVKEGSPQLMDIEQGHCSIQSRELNNKPSSAIEERMEVAEEPKPGCSRNIVSNQNKQEISIPTVGNSISSIGHSPSIGNSIPMVESLFSPNQRQVLRLVKSRTLPELGKGPVQVEEKDLGPSALSISEPMIGNDTGFKALLNPGSNEIEVEIGSVMVWSLKEAKEKSTSQIGRSACGATALLNALRALGFEMTADEVNTAVGTRLRAEDADLPEYLFSRASAGATHEDIISGAEKLMGDRVIARFFQPNPNMSPETLSIFLLNWICKGMIPILTINPQVNVNDDIPDAWHHQMVFGVSPKGIFLVNPLEVVTASILLPQLTSPSTLLVRREDVLLRKKIDTNLRKLTSHPDPRWNTLNVLGQVGNMLLEGCPVVKGTCLARRLRTSHLKIPAEYSAGITLIGRSDSPNSQALRDANPNFMACSSISEKRPQASSS